MARPPLTAFLSASALALTASLPGCARDTVTVGSNGDVDEEAVVL
jgi:hypothetical protein